MPANRLRIPLISFRVAKLAYTVKSLRRELARGVQITGAIPAPNFLAPRATSAAKKMAALRAGLRRRNRNILRAIENMNNAALKAKWCKLSRIEHKKAGFPSLSLLRRQTSPKLRFRPGSASQGSTACRNPNTLSSMTYIEVVCELNFRYRRHRLPK